MTLFRIGTRGSKLALAQAYEVRARLCAAHKDLSKALIKIVPIKTTGDKILDKNLEDIGGKGLFTKEVEEALINGDIDIAVHSMKDVPAINPEPLTIDCILPREDPRDAFVSLNYASLNDLPKGATLGTSSSRRKSQLLAIRPDLRIVPFRGNVITRLEKLQHGIADATLLAMAGLNRIELSHHAREAVDTEILLPAVAQGAIGIQRRKNDTDIEARLAPLNHADSAICIEAERAFLTALEGSCRTPIAAYAELKENGLFLRTLIAARDGSKIYRTTRSGALSDAEAMGKEAAEELYAMGGRAILEAA